MRAYNLIELFNFITEDLEMYFQRNYWPLPLAKLKISILHRGVLVQQAQQSNSVLSNKARLPLYNSLYLAELIQR